MRDFNIISSARIAEVDRALAESKPDRVSREHWAEAAGAVLARSLTPVAMHIIVSMGFEMFIKRARGVYAGHAFTQDNYRRIWEILVRTARNNPLDGPVNIEHIAQ